MGSDGTDARDDSDALRGGDVTDARDAAERSGFGDDGDDCGGFVWDVELDDDRPKRGTTGGERETAEAAETTDTVGDGTDPADPARDRESLDRPDGAGSTVSRTLDPERYLLAGETIAERVDVRRGWVVATSHRLLVFDPESSSTRFVTVERPNVVDVRTTGGGNRRIRSYAGRAGLYGVVLLTGGFVARGLGLRSLFTASPDVGTTPGVSGLVSALSLVGTLASLVVDLLFFGGLAAGLVGLALGVWYVRGRQPTLVVERAGEDDLEFELPSNAVGRRLVDSLERGLSEELALNRG